MEPLSTLSLDRFPEMSHELKAFIIARDTHYIQRLEALKAEVILLKRFRYGSSSERKKKV